MGATTPGGIIEAALSVSLMFLGPVVLVVGLVKGFDPATLAAGCACLVTAKYLV